MNWKFWNEKSKFGKLIEKIISNKPKFPCAPESNCLVLPACTKPCDKIEMDDNKIRDLFLKYKGCPDCGGKIFIEGPSGGICTNVKCDGCGHYFNMALPLIVERIIHNGKFKR